MNKTQTTITEWLLALTALASLPMLAFALFTIDQLGKSGEANTVADLQRRTESLAYVIDQRLQSHFGLLQALATSEPAIRGDVAELYRHSKRLIATMPDYRAITLIDRDEKMLFFTLAPLGTAMPATADPASVRSVFKTGRPTVSALFTSPISDRHAVALNVPVMRDGNIAYCLRLIILSDTLNALIQQQQLPDAWVTSLIDPQGVLIARSHESKRYIGRVTAPDTLKAIQQRQPQVFEGLRIDGIRYMNAVQPLERWGWSVVVGVPVKTLYKPARETFSRSALISALLVAVSLLAAFFVARHISRQVRGVVQLSSALLNDEQLPEDSGRIHELAHLRESMLEFSRRHKKANRDLANASEQTASALTALEKSQNDTLTGLAGRAKFLQRMALLHAELGEGPRRLALMYIDLDNFKQVNDQLGHAMGDDVLRQAAEVFRTVVRDTDIAGRLGGDEFVIGVVGPAEGMETSVAALADRIVERIGVIGHGIGCSIGIAVWTADCAHLELLMQRADEAMYAAKRAGKNQHATWSAALETAS